MWFDKRKLKQNSAQHIDQKFKLDNKKNYYALKIKMTQPPRSKEAMNWVSNVRIEVTLFPIKNCLGR